ncbi:aconitate hydratase AcnA [Blastopirellula sp. JC732]|uniref:Aconitate hydratase n=1 Tax=Blastopirellula sediminis TaxID=2894196 RepID=A0A9X1MK34_9BACT|nr:aconitate hydratase AcnA [Blastopirellula sediminis]MCC9607840.1 aconitate hydratase AcnA [Blastopirellula sediminis]MCC9627367.1 aconitate hydratase AcnA [Blastopirellula sediminis]
MGTVFDPFGARDTFSAPQGELGIYRIRRLQDQGLCDIDSLPYSIRILLEAVLRSCDGFVVSEDDVRRLAAWNPQNPDPSEVPFMPARVVLQDFTGVPAVVDLAAMRSAMKRLGGDPNKINPLIPVDLVIDHSVQVDAFGHADSLEKNVELEFQRNGERYEFLRWGQKALDNFRAVPPNVGIVHQVNLEFLAKGVFVRDDAKGPVAIPDSLVGTDSHTTMINGLGVVGWGVGGIEAEAVMLGQPIYMLTPEVVGFEITGQLAPGVTATDLVLTVTQILRKEGVVGKFVEFFGEGVSKMSLADRATIANMAPEYGATMGFFPVDAETLNYLRRTGRTEEEVALVETYTKELGIFRSDDAPTPKFTTLLKLDVSTVEPSMAGPKRPQDRVALANMKSEFQRSLKAPIDQRGFALADEELAKTGTVQENGSSETIGHGAVVIAAITSCTNTSNPSVMLAAGLLARNAVAKGLRVPSYVKTSLAPGSRVVTDYLNKAGLMDDLEALGFSLVGYGCTTCIGNSGPLPDPVAAAVTSGNLVASAVLSGNRNFEGRVNPLVKANYLASPPLVVAYAIAGSTDIDLVTEPIGKGSDGADVYLKDIWPTSEEVLATIDSAVTPDMFQTQYNSAFESNPTWNKIAVVEGELYDWNDDSTYIQEPPFMVDMGVEPDALQPIAGARVLALLGDSVTTDHISPAGAIAKDSPAGRYLIEKGVQPIDFNSYGSRRGNDRVMHRGTFANIRIRNRLAPGTEGGWTRYLPTGEVMAIYDAAEKYKADGTPLVVLAGKEYGTGSSRDWAAKGTFLLGVKSVITSSFERIHRSNLVGMGILPLEFPAGKSWETLGLTGEESFDIVVADDLLPGGQVPVKATRPDGSVLEFTAKCRIDTPVEMEYYRNGGILQTVLRKLLKG